MLRVADVGDRSGRLLYFAAVRSGNRCHRDCLRDWPTVIAQRLLV